MNHLRKLKSLLLLLLVAVSARAQISEGNVYNFVNVGNNTQSMVIAANNFVSIAATNTNDYDQLWYVSKNSDNSYSLRNLGSGRYLRSSNAASVKWTMVKEDDFDANCKFNCTAAGSGYTLRATNTDNGGHYMHYGANNGGVVGWSTDAAATQWTITPVSIDENTLTANWNELAKIDPSASIVDTYQGNLETLFSDKACTTLNSTYASMDVNTLKNQTAYKNLPVALQQMVLKVRNNSWGEGNYDANKSSWDADYAKKYRVQLYEPYNEPEAAASALGINAHTNLNNPTGIFANDREALYVMVGGTIKEGASLYIASYTGNGEPGGYAEGVELKQGLNIVPSFGDGNNYVINYVVHTFDTSNGKMGNEAKARRLSAYDDLKIHIEGGYINGYWNKMGDELYTPDTHENWDYLKNRATQTTVTILGEYITLQFPLRDEDAVEDKGTQHHGLAHYLNQVDVNDVIDEWDDIMMWQRFLLGVLDKATTKDTEKNVVSPYSNGKLVVDYTGDDDYGYSDYYNVHGLSLGVGYNYMFGGWRHCGYNYNTMESIIVHMLTSAGSHWGPGHEIGHQHQALFNLNGLTEVTNNLFANVVLWYFGETTSRVNGDEGSLSNVLAAYNAEGSDFYTNNIWGQTHLYYKLFLYYHVLGHNNQFYPTLFEMLRQDPMINGGQIDGATSLLHFYKKCCEAAKEDLTEFFRAYGFFSVMTNRLVDDYNDATYNMTQAQIDAAIAEVKAHKYEENIAVLFINDATGETIKSHKGGLLSLYDRDGDDLDHDGNRDEPYPFTLAELGGYDSFNTNTTPNYTYTVSGNTVTMEGEGGTGFAIFNEKGELLAFSDKKTFIISDECAVALASGKAEVKAVQADKTLVEATDVMDTDNTEAKYAALGELLTAAANLLTYSDPDNSKPGFYKASVMQTLQHLYTEAQSVYNNKEVASYATAYAALYQEYVHIATLETDKTPFLPGSTYVLTNKKYPTTAMTLSANGMMCVYNSSSSAQQWTFEATNEKDIYYLKNGNNYLGSLLQSTQVGVTTRDRASRYKLFDLGKGLWALQCQNDSRELQSLHCDGSYSIVGWSHTSTDNDASWWYLTATAKDESMLPLYDLQNLIAKTEALVDEMATVQGKGTAVELSAENITSNATEDGHETKYLLDGNAGTYFHTVWASSSVGEPHYLQVDLGEGKSLSEFVWTYTTYTTTWNADLPTNVKVTGSTDAQLWHDIKTLSNLPTTQNTVYKSATLGNSTQNYRYLRFAVTATSTGGKVNNQYYFGLGEMGLIRMSTLVEAIDEKYTNFISAEEVATVCDQIYAAQQACASGAVTSADIDALQEQYNILLAAYENANNVEFNAKKQELLDLISSTNSLINTCGTVKIVEGGKLALSTSQGSGDAYFTQWSYGSSDGAFADLIDGSVSTFYVSNWSDTPAEHPYLQVQLPEGKELGKFTFTFTGRNSGNAPAPTKIVVSGSNNGSTFTEIETFTKDGTWPVAANNQTITPRTWTSPTITPNTAYKYLRFTVTAAERTSPANVNNSRGYCHYGISEFGVSRVGEITVTLSGEHGDADEELLLATYQAVQTADAAGDRATTEKQLQNIIDELKGQYDALYAAMYPSVEYTVSSNLTGGGVTFEGGEPCLGGGTLTVPASLTLDELKAKLAAIKLSGYVAQPITINEGVITIIYNKVYTVYINGGEGEGHITFNGRAYANEGTFNVQQGSFTVTDLTASDVDGYTKSAVTVDHETGIISVTYTLDTSALTDLLESTQILIITCQGFVNSQFVTESLKSKTNTAWATAQNALETVQTRSELNDAVSALQTAYNKLDAAKNQAIAEAEERAELKEQLTSLINETETLIASCYENGALKYVSSEFVTDASIAEIRSAIETAQAKCETTGTTANEYNASISELTEAKSNLAAAIENAEEEAEQRVQLQAELQALVGRTQSLMGNCGTVTFVEATAGQTVDLQTDEPTGAGYLSANSTQSDNMSVAKLLDGDINSYYHSSWNVATEDDHYLQVYLGEGQSLVEFTFTYATRNEANSNNTSPAPTKIQVYGSSNGTSFTESGLLATFTKEDDNLPAYTSAGADWTSVNITSSATYKYLRFYVRTSDGPGNEQKDGHYFFAMSMFGLTSVGQPARYDVELAAPGVRGVTEELLREAYVENAAASALLETAASNADLQTAITSLQTAYNELEEAYNTYVFDKSELQSLIAQTRTLIASCYEDETFKYTGSLYITEALVNTTSGKADDAQTVFESNVDEATYNAALAELQAAYEELQYAVECALFPVLLTTDPASPALYTIKTKRGGNPVLQYDEATEMFSVTTAVAGQATQAFYFMKGEKVKGTQQVYIYPYMAGGKVLAANDVTDGKEKALAMDKGTATYEQWVFVERADGYYNLQPAGTTTYLSNIYGTSSKMGFYSSNPAGDEGSLLMFEATTVEGGYYYLKLKEYYNTQAKVASSDIQGGTTVGYYPVAQATAYNTAYAAATAALANNATTEVEYKTAYTNLVEANEALELIMPSADKYYRFVSVVKKDDNDNYAFAYANPADNKMYWATNKTTSDATAIWTITPSETEGMYNVTNLHTGSNINGFIYYDPSPLSEMVGDVSIVSLSANDGQIGIKCNGTMMHAQGDGAIVHWDTGADDASAWRIVEVTEDELSSVQFALTIGKYHHAGLYLNYAVVIPEGVRVYIVHTPNAGEGTIYAEALEGTILPKRTAVIVRGEDTTDGTPYKFKYTTNENTIDDFEANLLGGSAYLKYQQVEESGNLCCVFGQKSGEVGLYKNWVGYSDANGTLVDSNGNNKADEDDGSYFKISPNKVYYEYKPSTVAGASAFRFRFNDATGIDELMIDEEFVAYDLYGRRLTEVVTPGIYIVNGKKVYVSEKMIGNK